MKSASVGMAAHRAASGLIEQRSLQDRSVTGMAAMPLSTFFQCPRCGHPGRINKDLPARAALRCPRCDKIFRFPPSKAADADIKADYGGLPPDRILELFTPDERPKPVARTDEIDIRCFTDSNEPLPPRAEAPIPRGKKKVLLDGKAPPFQHSRGFIAAILVTAVAMVGVAFVIWYVDTIMFLSKHVDNAGKARGRQLDDLGKGNPNKKAPPKPMGSGQSALPVAPATRVVAPATAQIGELVVGVWAAQIVPNERLAADERLSLTLRITNLSQKPTKYVSWSQVNMSAVLRDRNRNYYNRITLPTRSMVVIEPTVTILDAIEFEATPTNVELELDLTVAGSEKSFQFRIPASSIRRATAAPFAAMAQKSLPVSQVPFDPEKDPRLRAAVKAAYREGVKQVKRNTMSLSPKAAASKQKKEEPKLIKALADQFTLTIEQITRMITEP
jgi:hypothetical protein